MLSSLSLCPFYPRDPKQGRCGGEKAPPLLIASTFRQFEGGEKKIWVGIIKISPLVISTATEALLQIPALDNSRGHIIILWKYRVRIYIHLI